MNHLGTVTIETQRLILRRLTEEDIEPAFRNWTSDPAVTTFLRWPTHRDISITRMVVADWIASYEKADFYHWAIVPKDIGEPIGTIAVVDTDERIEKVHVGYCIGSKWWRQGYTSEAFAALIPFFFEQVSANRIESQHDPMNPGSGKVMEKCGLTYEGTLRQNDFSNRGIVDAAMYGLLRSEYLERKNK
ncbi:MAG: GNAT family N-acetyltransferase [Clostridiales bacterium]|nr:GNAT family N-acetyltransferase [Clostridiales bacterium]